MTSCTVTVTHEIFSAPPLLHYYSYVGPKGLKEGYFLPLAAASIVLPIVNLAFNERNAFLAKWPDSQMLIPYYDDAHSQHRYHFLTTA